MVKYNFFFNFFKLIKKCIRGCIILNTWYINVGALTSKPFAFKAWSWELETSYIVNISDGLADKIRIDLKGLEVVRVLPWLNNKNMEKWISDKIRFSYDGFSFNWINKFYLWKKLIFVPLIYLILFSNNNLFKKYFKYFLKNNNFLKKYWSFKNSKIAFFEYYFSFIKIYNFFSNLFYNYSSIEFLYKNTELGLNKFLYKGLYLQYVPFNLNLNTFLKLNNLILKKYLKKFLKKYSQVSTKKLELIFSNFYSFNFEKLYFFVYFTMFNKHVMKNFNLFSPIIASDLLITKYINEGNFFFLKNFNKNIFWNIINFKTKNLFKNFSYISFFNEKDNFLWGSFVFLLGSNIWLNAPRLHLSLRRFVWLNSIDILSFANNDFLLFDNLNIGFDLNVLKNIFLGKHWVNNFFVKKNNIYIILGLEFIENLKFSILFKNLKLLNGFYWNFVFNNLFNSNLNKIKNKKINFFTTFFIFLFLPKLISQTFKLYLDYKFTFLKKMWIYKTFSNNKKINSNLNLFFNLVEFKQYKYLLKTFFNVKNSLNVLVESSISNSWISKIIDFIIPISNFIENFNVYKTYQGFINKSLFIKFGPWLSKNIIIYLSILNSVRVFPYFWLLDFNYFNIKLIYLTISSWLIGLTKKYYFFKKKIIIELPLTFLFLKKDVKNNINLIQKTNFWNSNLSFIRASKYAKLGYNLSKKINKTFQML